MMNENYDKANLKVLTWSESLSHYKDKFINVDTMEEHILKRLLYSKALLLHGSKHAEEDNALEGAFAILNFDNSVEMLMNTILEYFGAPYKPERKFHELIDSVINVVKNKNNKINVDKLLRVRELKNLHCARNIIQHNGIIPAVDEVRRYHILTQKIVEGIILELFNLHFMDVSLGSLIKDTDISELYKKADKEYEKANYKKAIIYCVAAFESAKSKEQPRIYGSGIFWGKLIIAGKIPENIEKYLDIIVGELEILKLRLDYKKYQKYRDLSPSLQPFFKISQEDIISQIDKIVQKKLSELDTLVLRESARFYLDFSLESILRWESVLREGWNTPLHEIEPIVE